MAAKFIPLKEAAALLGLTSEEVVEMRSQGKIHGYREGATWKFKADEIERVAEELGSSRGGGQGAAAAFEEDLSDVIGMGAQDSSADDDKTIAAESDPDLSLATDEESASNSDVALVPSDGSGSGGSDVALVPDVESDSDVSSDSDGGVVEDVASASDVLAPPEGSDVLSGSDVMLKSPSGGGTGELERGSDVLSGSDVEVKMPDGGGTGEIELGGSDLEMGSDAVGLSDEELDLGEEDDNLVLGGSGLGSDVTLDSADSGINLTSPSDSGLSLEEAPPDLAGSGPSLEMPKKTPAPRRKPAAEPEETVQVEQDEEFLLAPSDDGGADETDSGSQVIAIDGEDMFAEEAAPLGEGLEPLLAEEPAGAEAGLEILEGPADGAAAMVPLGAAAAAYPSELPEAAYTVWNIVGLLLIVLFLGLGGMLMTDVVRNIWSWNGGFSATTSLMDAMVQALGMAP